jgi:hypothetical protein
MNVRAHAVICLLGLWLGASAPAFGYETWQAEDLELRIDLQGYTRFAGSQYQHTGDTLQLVNPETRGRYQQLGIAIDGEFGLFKDVALYVQTAVQSSKVTSNFGQSRVAGLSDLHLGGKWRAYDGSMTLTLAPEVKFPTGYTADAGTYHPTLGNGVNEYTARLWVGKRFVDAPFYFEVGTGYRLRGSRVPRGGGPKLIYSDEIPYDIEIGFDLGEKITVLLFVDGVVGLGKAETVTTIELSSPTQSYTHVGGGLSYRLNQTIRILAQYRTTVAGINALNSQFIGLGANIDYGI